MGYGAIEFTNPHVGNRNASADNIRQGVIPVLEHLLSFPRDALRLDGLVVASCAKNLHDFLYIPTRFTCRLRVTNIIVKLMSTQGARCEYYF